MRKRYDLAFGVGQACSCSQALRASHLQFLSFPLDWTAPFGSHGMVRYTEAVCGGFANWFEKEDFVLLPQGDVAEWEVADADTYHNTRTNFFFPHDFVRGTDFDKAYDEVASKYCRRIDRFLCLLKSAARVLIVRMDSPALKCVTTVDECKEAREMLMAKFPGIVFDVIYLTIDRKRPYERRLEELVSPGVLHVAFDYASHRPGAPSYLTESALTAAVLAEHAKVRDYRTREERRSYERRRHAERWAKLGAKTFWGYQLARLRKAFGK